MSGPIAPADPLALTSPVLRWLPALAGALIVSGILSWAMFSLINTGQQQLQDNSRLYRLNFVRVKREEIIHRKTLRPKKPPTPGAVPQEPRTPVLSAPGSSIHKIALTSAPVKTDISLSAEGFSLNISEQSEYLPIAKVAPIYPRRAAQRGIEGYCMVEYTVKADGSVSGVEVIDGKCSHSSFKKPSIKAARKFKYKPRVIDGVKVDVPGVRNRFTYQLVNGK